MSENPSKYEATDLQPGAIFRIALGLAIALGVIFLSIWIFMRALHHAAPNAQRASRITVPGALPPEPRLQVDEIADFQQMRAANEAELHSYGWVDRDGGIIRIPIERAIELTASRGLPFRKPATLPAKPETPP